VLEAIAVALAQQGTRAVFRSLAAGDASGEAWANFGADLLGAVLQQQDETNATLVRLEDKIDRLLLERFRDPFRSGVRLLEQAQLVWANEQRRQAVLGSARDRFTDAATAAPDPLARAVAEWYLGVTWLLSGAPAAAEDAWAHARDAVLLAIDEAQSLLRPSPEDISAERSKEFTTFQRLVHVSYDEMARKYDLAEGRLRSGAREHVDAASKVSTLIERSRTELRTAILRAR
jgi:hypothetical protein